jgi:hypothetical protein
MTAARRWWCVCVGVAVLVAAPFVVAAVPAHDADVSAVSVQRRIERSATVPFSGYAESTGTLSLPTDRGGPGLADLLGGHSRVRVWWQDPQRWRTAQLRTTGETDLVHDAGVTTKWEYESKTVTISPDVPIHLPTTYDVLPNVLAHTVLSGARRSELERLPAVKVAGHDALGLRLRPSEPQASIGHVDVYADAGSGLPLRVSVFARGSRTAALTTSYVDLSLAPPAASALRAPRPPDGDAHFADIVDVASAVDRFGDRVPPRRLAGLPARHVKGAESVGVYGRGLTFLVALPLWERFAEDLCQELERLPGARRTDAGMLVSTGPLHLLLSAREEDGTSWLLVGTVTEHALMRGAAQLAAHPPRHEQ